MTRSFWPSIKPFWQSVWIGAYAGICIAAVLWAWGGPIDYAELWAIPIIIAVYGMLAVPFVAFGLALFGLPLTFLLRPRADRWWVGVIAIVWGAVAGKIAYFMVDYVVFFGQYDITEFDLRDTGVMFGVPTGVAWWLSQRRALPAV